MFRMIRDNHFVQIVLLGAMLLIGYGLYVAIDTRQFPPDYSEARQSLSTARERWSRHPVSHYRLDIQFYRHQSADKFGPELCEMDVEIVDEAVINTHTDTCNFDFQVTITALFAQIERITNSRCLADGCPPTMPNVAADYNGDYGFPATVYFWSVPNPRREYLLDIYSTPPAYSIRHFTVLED